MVFVYRLQMRTSLRISQEEAEAISSGNRMQVRIVDAPGVNDGVAQEAADSRQARSKLRKSPGKQPLHKDIAGPTCTWNSPS